MNIIEIDSDVICKMLLSAYSLLDKSKDTINEMNVFPIPDGDTGTNMALTLKEAIDSIKEADKNMNSVAKCISNGALMGARGNSGVILSQLIRGFMNSIKNKEVLNAKDISYAMDEGLSTAYKAVLKPKEGTILTVAREITRASYVYKNGDDISDMLKELINKGDDVLKRTPDMLSVLKQAGVVDSGGMGLMIILKGALKGLENENAEDDLNTDKKVIKEVKAPVVYENDIKYMYCTEFIVDNSKGKNIKNELKKFGDSFIYVEGDGLIKVHIHTNNPDKVLGCALKLGEVLKVKIENMKQQHTALLEENSYKKYSILSIINGSGFEKIFKDLGTDMTINGGQTMNPSTQIIVDALNKIKAENIFVLPNNSNIIMAAEQAAEIIDRNVHVVQARTIPQGIMALIAFNGEADLNENIKNMDEACLKVKTGEITTASKNTNIDELQIKKGQIIALLDGKITLVTNTIYDAVTNLFDKFFKDEINYINIYYGKKFSKEVNDRIKHYLQKFNVEFEILEGGQDIYDYIVSVC